MMYKLCIIVAVVVAVSAKSPRYIPDFGFRCPREMLSDLNDVSEVPKFCYDVIGDNGACLLDDMILTRDQCISFFGQAYYDDLVETQAAVDRKFDNN
ncbi:hypothetical protein SNE40_012341 [Patella caerulea]|uniref:Uncharacterized protein n=1 Tax=Patella caerulea TaxID=87958 RepID=A0AAN8JLN7_PATCE